MKGKLIFIFLYITTFNFLLAGESSGFGHPLRIEPAGIYNKIRLDGSYTERKNGGTFEKDKNVSLEGEYIFLNNFSLKFAGGVTRYDTTNSKTITQNDRWNAALKYARESSGTGFRFVWGGGVRIFNKQVGENIRYDVAPDLYLVRPNLSLGVGLGIFEFQADLSMQSETNSKFREAENQEFRRFYQAGGLASVKLGDLRLILETEVREPYNKTIDIKSRFWNVYPGISYKILDQTMLSISGQFPVNGEAGELGKGFRFSLFQFF